MKVVIVLVIIISASVLFVSLYFKYKSRHVQIRTIDANEYDHLLSSIGSYIAGKGYLIQSQTPGLSVYQKQEHRGASILIALFWFAMCIIPGLIYLGMSAGRVETSIVSIHIGDNNQGHCFNIKAPMNIQRKILNMLKPYQVATP